MAPRLLDLFCGAGGASEGYRRAGFELLGVDLHPQPNYPFPFVQGDAVEFIRANWREFDAFAGSPPCQGHSVLRFSNTREYLDLIPATREAMVQTGRPWAIENVEGAPLRGPVTLCGSMFGLGSEEFKLKRHRKFEVSVPVPQPPDTCGKDPREVLGIYGGKVRTRTRTNPRTLGLAVGRAVMGVDWMTRKELCQAIPPAYTEYIGRSLLAAIES